MRHGRRPPASWPVNLAVWLLYQQPDKGKRMTGLSLTELEEQRDRLYAQLAATGDFRRGSVTENYRR